MKNKFCDSDTPRCMLLMMLSIEKLSSWHLKLQCSDTFPHSCIRNIILCLITMAFWNRSKNGFLWTDFTNDRTGQRHVQWLSRVPWWQNSDLVPWLERQVLQRPWKYGCLILEPIVLYQGSANLFYKVFSSKYFWLCGPYGLRSNYSPLPLWHESSRRWYVNKYIWLSSNKTWFMKTDRGLDLARRL